MGDNRVADGSVRHRRDDRYLEGGHRFACIGSDHCEAKIRLSLPTRAFMKVRWPRLREMPGEVLAALTTPNDQDVVLLGGGIEPSVYTKPFMRS